MADDSAFLGTGWAFPLTFENQGRAVRMATAEQDILESLRILLSTELGERVMRPRFGWSRSMLVHEPLSNSFATYLRREIETAVLYFEPRITLDRVVFEAPPDATGRVDIRVEYTVRSTNSRANLVYPFYLEEASQG